MAVGRSRASTPDIMLQFDLHCRIKRVTRCAIRTFLGQGILDLDSARHLKWRYFAISYLSRACAYDPCVGTLLRSDDPIEQNGVKNSSQLAEYAAEHWVTHAKYENVSSFLRKEMEYLFDLDKPYFTAWQQLHDIDIYSAWDPAFFQFTPLEKSNAVPLYYAALCGFQDLVGHLIVKNPQDVNASGGYYVTPLVAALSGKHFQTARILHDNGAHPNVRGRDDTTPLHAAAHQGDLQMVQVLLEYMADLNSRTNYGDTPLHFCQMNSGQTPISLNCAVSRELCSSKVQTSTRATMIRPPRCMWRRKMGGSRSYVFCSNTELT